MLAVPEETPRSVLFRNRAKTFLNLASDLQAARPGYRELAAAYEQLANETERGEAIHAAAKPTPKTANTD
jgi:hypothetical protein